MPRQTTKEEEEEDDPLRRQRGFSLHGTHFKIVDERVTDGIGIQTVHEDSGRDVRETREDDDTCCQRELIRVRLTSQEHLPGGEVEQVEHVVEQTDQDPVQKG